MLSICIRNLFLVFLRVKTTYPIFSAVLPTKSACLWRPIFLILHLQKYEAGPEVLLPVKEAEMEAMRQPQAPGDRPSFEDYMRYKGIYICTLYTISLQKIKTQKRKTLFSFTVKECGTLKMQ
jgi:hypothetical protein